VEKIHKQLDNKRDTNKSMDVGVDNWNVGGTLFERAEPHFSEPPRGKDSQTT